MSTRFGSMAISRQSQPVVCGLRSPTFFKSNGEQGHYRSFAQQASWGSSTPGVEASIGSLMRSSKRSDRESITGGTTCCRSTVDHQASKPAAICDLHPSAVDHGSPSEGSLSPASSSGVDSVGRHNDVNRGSAAAHTVPFGNTNSKMSGRSLYAPTTQDGQTSSVELTPKATCNSPASRSPASSNALRSTKGSVSPVKKGRFGSMLIQSRARSLSIESLKVVASLEECYAKYVAYEKEMRALVAAVNAGQVNPGEAKTKVALLESALSKLQGNGIDSVKTTYLVSGQESCKKLRKELTLKVERMLNYIETIFPMLTERTSMYFANLDAASTIA
eukprot:GEMP01039125.1.p1 GENE.GEMP01039125.1~~GEMP01039125.1.p1  ORF type:complete len:333 (+),score=50.50 GEMP01039125.1:210-1208(+)